MRSILTAAGTTWRVVLKMKVVYFLVLCVWILIGCMYRYNEISLNRHRELMLDMTLLLTQIGAILSILTLTFDIPHELHEGVAASYLTKSLGRTRYLIGKTLGAYFVAGIVCTLISVGSYLIYTYCFPEPILRFYIKIQLLILLSVIPMGAVCAFCAVVFPDMAAPVVALIAVWLLTQIRQLHIPVLNGGILPDLDLFNMKEHIIYNAALPWEYILGTAVYGICSAVFLLSLTAILFRLKDIK